MSANSDSCPYLLGLDSSLVTQTLPVLSSKTLYETHCQVASLGFLAFSPSHPLAW